YLRTPDLCSLSGMAPSCGQKKDYRMMLQQFDTNHIDLFIFPPMLNGYAPSTCRHIWFTGEGHAFEPGGERNWCDLCCMYIFENGLTCAGEGACD
uniref:Uncharacterized protein n=1 Tax=Neolamprologus brichardi TaxID=32507 RepID=A0A3Q4H302_NEOBR